MDDTPIMTGKVELYNCESSGCEFILVGLFSVAQDTESGLFEIKTTSTIDD